MQDREGTLSLPSNRHASRSTPEVISKRPSERRWSDSEKSIRRAVSSSTSTGSPPRLAHAERVDITTRAAASRTHPESVPSLGLA